VKIQAYTYKPDGIGQTVQLLVSGELPMKSLDPNDNTLQNSEKETAPTKQVSLLWSHVTNFEAEVEHYILSGKPIPERMLTYLVGPQTSKS
jgi:hypothetical protein